jgi:hypothetical protein
LLSDSKKSIEYNNGEDVALDSTAVNMEDFILIKLADLPKLQRCGYKDTSALISLDTGSLVEISNKSK